MGSKVSLYLSDKAYDKLTKLSRKLGLSRDEFAILCFEYVDIKHQGIVNAAKRLKQKKKAKSVKKQDLSKHLERLSSDQIELLLNLAAQKKKS